MRIKAHLKTTSDYRTLLVYEVLDAQGIENLFSGQRKVGAGYEINNLRAYEVVNFQALPYILRRILAKSCLIIEDCKKLEEGRNGQENSSPQNLSGPTCQTPSRQRGRRKKV